MTERPVMKSVLHEVDRNIEHVHGFGLATAMFSDWAWLQLIGLILALAGMVWRILKDRVRERLWLAFRGRWRAFWRRVKP